MDAAARTGGLVLRQYDESDKTRLVELIGNAKVARFLASVPHPYTMADADVFFRDFLTRSDIQIYALSEADSPGILAGAVGLENIVHGKNSDDSNGTLSSAVLGFWLGEQYWGKGHMTHAVGEILCIAFEDLKLDQVHSTYFVDNVRSKRVHEKLGFIAVASKESNTLVHSLARDRAVEVEHVMLTREQWTLRNIALSNKNLVLDRQSIASSKSAEAAVFFLAALLAVFTGVHLLLSSVISQDLLRLNGGEYMDEIFHAPQTREFCMAYRRWKSPSIHTSAYDTFYDVMKMYDPKITTPPGLYVIAASYSIDVVGDHDCSSRSLRSLNTFFQAGTFVLLIATCRALSHNEKPENVMRGRLRASLVGMVLALSPVHCFTGLLYYTDPASTFFVLLVHYLTVCNHRNRNEGISSNAFTGAWTVARHALTSIAGVLAIACRQNNVVWVAFCMGIRILYYVEEEKLSKNSLVNECKRLWSCVSLRSWILQLFLNPISPSALWPFLCAIVAFIFSFVMNGYSVVLGDKSNHKPVWHLCQLLYFAVLTGSVFSLDWFVHRKHNIVCVFKSMLGSKGICWYRVLSSVFLVGLCAAAVAFANPTHPFMLADNRHYIFYIWRKTGLANKKDGVVQYLLSPIYVILWWGMLRRLRGNFPMSRHLDIEDVKDRDEVQLRRGKLSAKPLRSWFWILGFLLCTALVLVPAHLVEFRYFIIPSMLMQIHMLSVNDAPVDGIKWGGVPIGTLFFTLILHLMVNAITINVFLWKGFRAPDGSYARFMW